MRTVRFPRNGARLGWPGVWVSGLNVCAEAVRLLPQERSSPSQYYVGLTSDPDGRLRSHNAGLSPNTARQRPCRTLVCIEFDDEEPAVKDFRNTIISCPTSNSGREFCPTTTRASVWPPGFFTVLITAARCGCVDRGRPGHASYTRGRSSSWSRSPYRADHSIEHRTSFPSLLACCCWVVREDALAVAAGGGSGKRRRAGALRRDVDGAVVWERGSGRWGDRVERSILSLWQRNQQRTKPAVLLILPSGQPGKREIRSELRSQWR